MRRLENQAAIIKSDGSQLVAELYLEFINI